MNSQSQTCKGNGKPLAMFEHKRNLYKTGRNIGSGELKEECDILWGAMKPEEKEIYHKQARGPLLPKIEKYTSQGVSYSEIELQKLKKQREIEEINLDIDNMLNLAVEHDKLDKKEFFFVKTSYFVQTLRYDIFPAELALCKFSLKEGVIDIVNTLINPGPLPLGMSSTAQTHAEKTHQLPLPPNCEGVKEMEKLFEIISNFVGHEENKLPIMFTGTGQGSEEINATKLIMKKIWTTTFGTEAPCGFRIYPLNLFFFKLNEKRTEVNNKLHNTKKVGFASVFSAKDLLDRDMYEYAGIGCAYHEEKDASKYCCQSVVRRWVYTFAKHIYADESNCNLVSGKHFPLSYEECNAGSSKTKKKNIKDQYIDLTPPVMFALQEKYKNKNNRVPNQFANAADPFEAFNISRGGEPSKEIRTFNEISSLCTSYSSITIGRGRSPKSSSEKSGTSSKVVTGRGMPIVWDLDVDK
ncbi:unnamed protein product [Diamesa serratosioi]